MDAIDQVPMSASVGTARPVSAAGSSSLPLPLATLSANTSSSTSTSVPSSRLSAVHRPRHSMISADGNSSFASTTTTTMDEAGDRSIAALMCSTTKGSGSKCLKGVVAFVDVRTDEGSSAGDIWGDMLKALGAKVNVPFVSGGVFVRLSTRSSASAPSCRIPYRPD
jgi:hypothetical protein